MITLCTLYINTRHCKKKMTDIHQLGILLATAPKWKLLIVVGERRDKTIKISEKYLNIFSFKRTCNCLISSYLSIGIFLIFINTIISLSSPIYHLFRHINLESLLFHNSLIPFLMDSVYFTWIWYSTASLLMMYEIC